MIDHGNFVSDVKIAYIGGGSRGWAWTFMTDLALEPSMSGTIRLYDIDEQAAKTNEITKMFLGKALAEEIFACPSSFGGYQKLDTATFFG